MMVEGNTGDPTDSVTDLGLTLDPWDRAVAGLRTN